MKIINGNTYDEERALYALTDAKVTNCTFAGARDGESALKEAHGVEVEDCTFSLRYPFWHTVDFTVSGCKLGEGTRAAVWYARNGAFKNCDIRGIKFMRECKNITLSGITADSAEFGWRSEGVTIENCDINSQYFLFECKNVSVKNLKMTGKYSFQYIENMTVEDSVLDTKDAFWHTKNVTVKNSVVKGEYLGWYSDGLTLVNCKIIGTQPLCYCKNLKLVDCTMENTDLSFEYSEVEATVKGNIESVKNPKSGKITADSIGEIITEDSVIETNCEIAINK